MLESANDTMGDVKCHWFLVPNEKGFEIKSARNANFLAGSKEGKVLSEENIVHSIGKSTLGTMEKTQQTISLY